MKKQQTPVVLIALLVVFGGAMIAMRQRPTDAAPTDPMIEKGVTGDAREGVSTKDLSVAMKKNTTPKTLTPLDPKEQQSKTEPAILLPDYQDYKPTHNSTAPTGQWYKGGTTKSSN